MSRPTDLKIVTGRPALQIEWLDGQVREYTFAELRKACPCATCREVHVQQAAAPSPFAILRPEETRPLKILAMNPVGNYAYSIEFSDGHDTGIYTFELLQSLGQSVVR
ncbi:MAG: DUF971 domain-containing protein [Pirellulales bacterium]